MIVAKTKMMKVYHFKIRTFCISPYCPTGSQNTSSTNGTSKYELIINHSLVLSRTARTFRISMASYKVRITKQQKIYISNAV